MNAVDHDEVTVVDTYGNIIGGIVGHVTLADGYPIHGLPIVLDCSLCDLAREVVNHEL